MKKLIFSLSLFLSFSSLVHAQWVTNGANTITSTSNSVGIGTTSPVSLLHVSGTGTLVDHVSQWENQGLIIQANTGGRSTTSGAVLEFAIPANIDGTNIWSQARIITVAGNTTTGNAVGKMILGTKRNFNKLGTGYGWYYGDDLAIDGTGNVGIGTATPGAALSIANSYPVIQLYDKDSNPLDGSYEGKLAFGSVGAEWASIEATRFTNTADDVTALKFKTSWATGAGGDGTNIERMRISFNGNVGIGTISPQNKLDVNGTVHSKAVNIDLNGWSDYVFKKDYQLRPLSEVKAYIEENQHLPEIPSEQEMTKKGLDVSEMNKLLMEKVEELTLYLIEKDKQAQAQQAEIDELKTQMKKLIKH